MSKPIGISELVALIGDENIQVQNLANNMTAANNGKKIQTITFATSPEHCRELMHTAAGLASAKVMALVIWFPIEKLPPDLRS